jgi:CheY-like chemotaxis protein
LDKIKRKTPGSSRRLPQASDPTAYSEQISKLESELDGLRTSNRFLLTRIDHLEEDFRMTLKNSNMLHEALMAQTALLHKTLGLLSQPHSSTVQFSSLQESMNSTQSRFLHPMNPSAPTNQAYANGNYHILLAEEDEVSVRICRKLLGQYGCEVDVANDGLEAVQRAEAGRYDLILINTILPSLDGLSCTELIRNFDSTTPIVAMMTPEDDSRSIDSRTVESYQKKGVTMILAKPFTKQDLYKTLGVFLKHPRSQISNHQNQPPPLEPQHPHQWMDAKKHPIRDDITDMSGMKKQRY